MASVRLRVGSCDFRGSSFHFPRRAIHEFTRTNTKEDAIGAYSAEVDRFIKANVRENFYSADGKLLKSTKKFLDLQTKRPKKPGQDFFDQEFLIFANVSTLPFYKLL